MSKVQKLFKKSENKKNFDGFAAYSVSIFEQYVQMVMVNTVGSTYYMDEKELFTYSVDLHEKMMKADPMFMSKTIVYARNKGMMRMQPVVGLAYLSRAADKAPFHAAFNSVIRTPDDLIDFVSVAGSIRNGKGMGRTVKRAINNWLTAGGKNDAGLSQYHAIKYGGGAKDGKWLLRDILRISRPIPKNTQQSALFNYIVHGTIDDSLEQVQAIEALKRLVPQKNELGAVEFSKKVVELINSGRLPHEIVTGIIKPDITVWEHLMKQMPIFALVRNLNTLDSAGVFSKKENIQYVIGQLTNEEIIKRSMMLPFRFSTAYDMFKGPVEISNALEKALDMSLGNVDIIPGKTEWFLDVSGSMKTSTLSHSKNDYVKIGSLLAIAGLKKSAESEFLCFGNELKYPRVNVERSTMSNLKAVEDVFGGCTSINLCIEYLLGTVRASASDNSRLFGGRNYANSFPVSMQRTTPTKADSVVIVTDEQQNSGTPLIQKFREYRKTVNPQARLFIIDVAPYNARMVNQEEPGVTFIYGWNDSVLQILRFSIEGTTSHVEQIKNMRLG